MQRFTDLRIRVADALDREAGNIAERWDRQARDVALRGEELSRDQAGRHTIVMLVRALAASLASDEVPGDGVGLGLAYGVDAFEAGSSLHHMLKGLDLLGAMTMYAIELAVSKESAGERSAADGVRLCRRLQQAASLVTLAATKGYTEAVSDELRDRFRHLRHDLRNPLGTIKSVLALMEDDTVPADTRTNPHFRAMANRNARSLEEMISARLSDTVALQSATTYQSVSLRTIASAVRRDLRAEWERREVTITIASSPPQVRVDAISLELVLHALLRAALQESRVGDELVLDFGEAARDRATVMLRCEPSRPPVTDRAACQRALRLSRRMGARLVLEDDITLSIPIRHAGAVDHHDAPSLAVTSDVVSSVVSDVTTAMTEAGPGNP